MAMSESPQRPGGEKSPFDYQPVAAEQYDGDHQCQYDCDATAEWAVEWKTSGYHGGKVSLICQSCSRKNRVYADENDLTEQDISRDGLEALPEKIVNDLVRGERDEQ